MCRFGLSWGNFHCSQSFFVCICRVPEGLTVFFLFYLLGKSTKLHLVKCLLEIYLKQLLDCSRFGYFSFIRLVHVVQDFRPWDVMMKVRHLSMLHFQFVGPWDAHRVKFKVDKVLWQVSRSFSTSIESSNYQFEPSKNNVLSSLSHGRKFWTTWTSF